MITILDNQTVKGLVAAIENEREHTYDLVDELKLSARQVESYLNAIRGLTTNLCVPRITPLDECDGFTLDDVMRFWGKCDEALSLLAAARKAAAGHDAPESERRANFKLGYLEGYCAAKRELERMTGYTAKIELPEEIPDKPAEETGTLEVESDAR